MVDAGPASWVLGMHVINDLSMGHISLDQTQYIVKLLEKFGMVSGHI